MFVFVHFFKYFFGCCCCLHPYPIYITWEDTTEERILKGGDEGKSAVRGSVEREKKMRTRLKFYVLPGWAPVGFT